MLECSVDEYPTADVLLMSTAEKQRMVWQTLHQLQHLTMEVNLVDLYINGDVL